MEEKSDFLNNNEEDTGLVVPIAKDIETASDTDLIVVEDDEANLDPVERITKTALRLCDLTYDRAFAIDKFNLGTTLGEYTMSRLMEIFIDRVYKDTDEWFRWTLALFLLFFVVHTALIVVHP